MSKRVNMPSSGGRRLPDRYVPGKSRLRNHAALFAAVAALTGPGILLTTEPSHSAPSGREIVPVTASVQGLPEVGFADLVEQVRPAVVSVNTERAIPENNVTARPGQPFGFNLPDDHPMRRFFDDFGDRFGQRKGDGAPTRRMQSHGSGFVISPDGYIVTNNHVIDEGDHITVTFQNGEEHDVTLVGVDKRTDLALLKMETDAPLDYVSFSEEDTLRVGDWVVAVGNPFGLGGTVTSGIVSARGRDIGSSPYGDFIQIDAPINRGNSGGPTFDLQGNVVGVNTAIYSPSGGNVGIGFAIPADTARDVIDQLREQGYVERGWLGVQIQGVDDDIADSLGLGEKRGALIAQIVPGSPAETTGLRPGDVVTIVNETEIDDVRSLTRTVAGLEVGKTARFTLWRDGQPLEVDVKIETWPEEEAQVTAAVQKDTSAVLGLTLEGGGDGVMITAVDPASDAARKGIRPGDVILSVGGEWVKTPESVDVQLDKARQMDREAVLMLIQSNEVQRYIALPVG